MPDRTVAVQVRSPTLGAILPLVSRLGPANDTKIELEGSVLETAIVTFIGAFAGAILGYGTNVLFHRTSRPRIEVFGFVWRPGRQDSRYSHEIDQGDLLKFWFRLKGRTNPGTSALEISYYPTQESTDPTISVFAKWDETANPETEIRRDDGSITRVFSSDRVPATYFLPIRKDRIYTIPIIWAQPPRDNPEEGSIIRAKMLLFSGWWFDPQRPRPISVASVSRTGRIELILSGEGLQWQKSFSVADVIARSLDLADANSDAYQTELSRILPRTHRWKE